MEQEKTYQLAKRTVESHIVAMQKREDTHYELAITAMLAMIESLHAEIQELKKAGG
jgi:hypothetical protein